MTVDQTAPFDHATAVHELAHGLASGAPFRIGFEDDFEGLNQEYGEPSPVVVVQWCEGTAKNIQISNFCGPLAQAAFELPDVPALKLIEQFCRNPHLLEPWASGSDMRLIEMGGDIRHLAEDPKAVATLLGIIRRARDKDDPLVRRLNAEYRSGSPVAFQAEGSHDEY